MLGDGFRAVNKTDKISCFMELTVQLVGTDNKYASGHN